MSKNRWLACTTIVIVLSCLCILCFLLSLAGFAGYIFLAPVYSWNSPYEHVAPIVPTASLQIIRPPAEAIEPTQDLPTPSTNPQTGAYTPTPDLPLPWMQVSSDTLHALESTNIPVNNPIDLAHRLLHMDDLSPTSNPLASPLEVGAHQEFWVGNGEVADFKVRASLRFITSHAYFWIEDGVRYNPDHLRQLAESFENQIYPTDRSFFGSEWTPGVDGDPHVYILYVRGIGEHIAGYFSSADEYPQQVNQYSNGHEMFMINADNSPLDDEYTYGVLAHELQHMIHWYQDRNESNWLSEGFSELAVLLNNFYSGGFDALYTSDTDLQLNNWPDDKQEDSTPHYGASFLFVSYFLDRFGEAATQALVANPDNDLNSVDSTLSLLAITDPLTGKPFTADRLFLDWAVTNYLMDGTVGDGRYTYARYRSTPRAEATQTINRCPATVNPNSVHQYGVDYIRIKCQGSYTLHFEGSIQTPLLPQYPHSGRYALWSNKSDESDMILTRSFDLTHTQGNLSLDYWTWYDLENGFDYVYLEASTDGENWRILNTPSGTGENPQGNSYGWGYTGASGGKSVPAWIHEKVDISQFAGHNLSLRFEYVTDANVTGEGLMIDDLSIPEAGYTTDFESDLSGWQADGWVRIENVLPQDYALALITKGKTIQVQDITLNPDISADIPIAIGNGVNEVILVVAGTTRYTRQLAPYRFSVSPP
ncbi:MAG: hypothetical protein ACM3H7_01370 [Acidobacteriaceae bacterium]